MIWKKATEMTKFWIGLNFEYMFLLSYVKQVKSINDLKSIVSSIFVSIFEHILSKIFVVEKYVIVFYFQR